MKFKLHIILLLIFIPTIGFSQKKVIVNGKEYFLVNATIENGDTVPYITLREVIILPPKVFTSARQQQQYLRLVRNLKKVYPYAKLARNKMFEIHNHLQTLNTDIEKKQYMKLAERELKDEFEDELKDLTMTQGRLLIKLIDRETGQTTYEIVKELRGSVQAFFWQSLARLFGSSLKTNYDDQGEDKMIEEILIRIDNGQI